MAYPETFVQREQHRISVRDHGGGIPKEKQSALFVRFQQLEDASTRRNGGTGLGLAISKSLVERLGGRIGMESDAGQGSVFWFELPRSFKLQEVT